jgi:hypothetical protein
MSKTKDHPTSMLIGPTRPAAAAPEDNHPTDQVEQEFGMKEMGSNEGNGVVSKHLTFQRAA